MRVLFITGSLNQGGAEYQILELAKLFHINGHKVEVFAITDYSYYKGFIEENRLVYSHLLNSQSKLLRVLLTSKKIHSFKPNIIVSYLRQTSQVALFGKIFSRSNARLIVGERTSLILPRYDFFYFNLMRLANIITVNSLKKERYLRKEFSFLNEKLFFFPNIIDTTKFKVVNKDRFSSELVLGFVGRVSPEKNILNLLKAVKLLRLESIIVSLLIFGDLRNQLYAAEINNYIRVNGLSEVVHLKGKVDKVHDAYQKIDLLCLISDYEGFSNVIGEALSSGIPVLTSDIEENKYLVQDSVNGFVVNQKDPLSIASGIKKFHKLSLNEKNSMSKTNRRKAEDLFDTYKIYQDYLKLINT